MRTNSATSKHALLLPLLASLAFVSLGLPDGLLGAAWPSMRASFGRSLDSQGVLLLALTTGYLVASFFTATILNHLTLGRLLAASGMATGLAVLGYAAAPAFWMLVVLGLVLGMGGGAIDAGINAWASTRHGPRMLNWLHGCWGIGAALGPVAVVLVLEAGRSWRLAYALVGSAQLLLAASFLLTSRFWTPTVGDNGQGHAAAGLRDALRLTRARLGALVYFVHVGVEVGFGVWAFTLFTEGRGIAPAPAGFWLSVFWGGLTASRLVASVLASRVSPATLVRGCLAAVSLGAALLWIDGAPLVAFLGLALAGMGCGPVFPTLIATTPERVPPRHVTQTVGLQVAGGALGAALLPAAMGVVAQRLGLETLGPQLLGLSVVALLSHEALLRHRPS